MSINLGQVKIHDSANQCVGCTVVKAKGQGEALINLGKKFKGHLAKSLNKKGQND